MPQIMVLILFTLVSLCNAPALSAAGQPAKKQIQTMHTQKTLAAKKISSSTKEKVKTKLTKYKKAEIGYNKALITLENAYKDSAKAREDLGKARNENGRKKAQKQIEKTNTLLETAKKAVSRTQSTYEKARTQLAISQRKHFQAKKQHTELVNMNWRTFAQNQKRYKNIKIARASIVLPRLVRDSTGQAEPNTNFTPM